MRLYRKNGILSRALRFAAVYLLFCDLCLIAGILMGLFPLAVQGDPVPMILRPYLWGIFGGNAAGLLVYVVYIMWRENRRIRMGVLSPELICEIMEGER